ncbi:restriction endonuclease subunit S [uncultured Polaribacter sp.]|uniref:restriction endonuclease subunit S n=1 Tax=uncultured Polaribacter sp. TaxID=174711 RepID=UPI00259AFE3C|nr:restriction endonuclease subunit S [uncultured Polaribacter sp.]
MREGWEIKKLGDVSNVQRGLTYGKNDTADYSENVVLRATNIKLESSSLDFDELKYLRDDFDIKDIYKLKVGSLLICFSSGSKNHLGKVAMVDKPYSAAFGGFIGQITPNEIINPRYLFYNLVSDNYRKYISDLTDGMNINNLKSGDLKQFPIPIPPLEEQKQIVAILDKAFAVIDQAKTNIEKNIANAKELFQSKLNDIFSQKGDGWEEKTLGEVCYVLNGYAFKSKESVEDSNTQLLRMGNLYKNVLDLSRKPVFYPDSYSNQYKDYLLKEGDLIMSLTGTVDKTDYGYTVKIPEVEVDLLLNQRIMKIEVHDSNILNKDYLKNYLLSPDFLMRLYDTSSGTRQANLSSRTILKLKINYPTDIDKQIEIVKLFKLLRGYSKNIEAKYQQKLIDLEDLKKSILQKAFAGELTKNAVAV